MVPKRGLEPPHPKAHGPEPCASTNSAIWATIWFSHYTAEIQAQANNCGEFYIKGKLCQ